MVITSDLLFHGISDGSRGKIWNQIRREGRRDGNEVIRHGSEITEAVKEVKWFSQIGITTKLPTPVTM